MTGGIIATGDIVVAGMLLVPSGKGVTARATVFAGYLDSANSLFVSSHPGTGGPTVPIQPNPDELVAAAIAYAEPGPDATSGDGIALLRVALPSGDITSSPVDTAGYEAGALTGKPSAVPADWFPIDVQSAGESDVWLLAGENYSDQSGARRHIFRLSGTGEILAHTLVEPDTAGLSGEITLHWFDTLSVTPQGLLLVGWFRESLGNLFDMHAIAFHYDNNLLFAGAYDVRSLAPFDVEWLAAATRDGRTIIAGAIERRTIVLHAHEFTE